MLTGDKFVNIVQKRLMGFGSFKNYFLDYLKDSSVALLAKVYNKDGTYHASVKVAITGSGNDEFDLADDKEGTDGSGHLLTTDRTSPAYDAYCDDVQFENTSAIVYDVALHHAELPSGVQKNPRTGYPEFQRFEEVIGVSDDPHTVTDDTDGTMTIRLPTSLCDNDRTHVNRKCAVWKKVPGKNALTESVAVEILDVKFSTFNYVETVAAFGQTTISETESDYTVLLLGPTVTRHSEKDLVAAVGYWFIGTVTGVGAGNPPTVFSTTDQRLITKSLSDWLDNLVYSNVINTFTRKQIFAPTTAEEAINATGNGANPGVKGTGGTNGNGQEGNGTGTGSGLVGKGGDTSGTGVVGEGGQGPGTGVLGKPGPVNGTSGVAVHGDGSANGGGYGGYFQGKTSTPVKAAAAIVPQGANPSSLADGDHWGNTADKKAKARVNGESRTYAQEKSIRTFLYPITCGVPDQQVTEPHWFWNSANHNWNSDNLVTPEYIVFDLNRFVPQGATLYAVRFYVDPGDDRSAKGNRTRVQLLSEDATGGDQTEHFRSYYPYYVITEHPPAWIYLLGGNHDGGDDQSILTDSWQTWTVDELVGRTIYNLTDGSSGTITANTANTVTATLSGGDNDWDDDDVYKIDLDEEITSATRQWYLMLWSGNDNQVDLLHSIEIQYIENEYLRVP